MVRSARWRGSERGSQKVRWRNREAGKWKLEERPLVTHDKKVDGGTRSRTKSAFHRKRGTAGQWSPCCNYPCHYLLLVQQP